MIDNNIERRYRSEQLPSLFSPEARLSTPLDLGRRAIERDFGEGLLSGGIDFNREVIVMGAGSASPFSYILDQHRAKFVRDKGWMPSNHTTDYDEYDDPGRETISLADVLHENENKEVIVSSLRLTKLDDLEECKSLAMAGVEDANDLPEEVLSEIHRAEEEGSLYDLTRMLPSSERVVTTDEYFESLIKLIGHSIEYTAIEHDTDPVWLFATTEGLHAKLEKLGMKNDVVAAIQRAREPKTVLCYVKPLEALEYVVSHQEKYPSTFKNVLLGIAEARRTLFV